MLNQNSNFCLIRLSIIITCLLDNLWKLQGKVTWESLPGAKGLRPHHLGMAQIVAFHSHMERYNDTDMAFSWNVALITK